MTHEDFYTVQIATSYIARLAKTLEGYENGEKADKMHLEGVKKQYEDTQRRSDNKPKDQHLKTEAASLKNAYEKTQAEVNDNITERAKDKDELLTRIEAFKKVEMDVLAKNFPKECLARE